MRKTTLTVAVATVLTSCSATSSRATRPAADSAPVEAHVIAGRVLDGSGQPTKAHIALVTENGSRSMGTHDGTFRFNGLSGDDLVLTAWTEDGHWTRLARVAAGTHGLELNANHAGAYVEVTMTGRKTARLAVFHDGLRFADRTVRDGKLMRFLVPAGETSYMLYGRDLERTQDLYLTAGDSQTVRFVLTR
ncbi:MAG: hypothetical protein ACI8QZ_000061 [Chlamydiales bacterium]|jgi:predicted methyltransferase